MIKIARDWTLNQSMSSADSPCEKGYADLRYTSKCSRDIRENMNAWKMEHLKRFTFSIISRDPFAVQQRSKYPFSQRKKADDIDRFNFQFVSFSIDKIRGKRNM